ncbi:MAG: hypothetical protein GY701_07055 [Sulfitobacter sp.]|nr:hypothetical protein [Sulfitobacter sp.]
MLGPSYTIGDQSVLLVPRQIGGYQGAPATVVGNGSLASEGFVSGGLTGWIIRGDGSFELAGGEFRGDIESSNFVTDVSGWHFDWDSGDGEFNGTLTARDIVTSPAGQSRMTLTDASGGIGAAWASLFAGTGSAEEDFPGYVSASTSDSSADSLLLETGDGFLLETGDSLLIEGAGLQGWLNIGAPRFHGSGDAPPSIAMGTESADGVASQGIIFTADTGGTPAPNGVWLRDDLSLYYGAIHSATQTYVVLSERADYWNFEWVRVNTGTNLIVDDYLGDIDLPYRTKRLTGTLDGSGVATLFHGITSAHWTVLFCQAWYKGGSSEAQNMSVDYIDGGRIRIFGGGASAACRVTIIYTDDTNKHAW